MINQSLKALVEQIALRANGASAAADAESTPASAEEAGPTSASPAYAMPAPVVAMAVPVEPSASPVPEPASFERRTVVVPDHEQLKPAAVVRGVVEDMLKERPWLPWVVIAFLLGVVFGRRRR
jgi:hypothetical protein